MNFSDIKYAYFLGIGGIGMSAIARYFNKLGVKVAGYDKTETELTITLANEGIKVHYQDDPDALLNLISSVEETLVVLTPAIPKGHKEWAWLAHNNYTILKRSAVLGLITDVYKTIGVAGTHGKTTTSTLIAHLLKQSHVDCSAFLGGISANYQSNLLLNQNKLAIENQWMVVEADEFDRSFLTLHPTTGIITSTDADHLDIYGDHKSLEASFLAYAEQVKETLIIKKELTLATNSFKTSAKVSSYSVKQEADYYADNIRITGDQYFFDLHYGNQVIENLFLGIPGLHNVENAIAASAASLIAGINAEELRHGLQSFKGVKRRFEYILKQDDITFIDDYAHHPEELRAIISSVKQMYPLKKLTAVFQPHLYTRTRDFVDGFAECLSLADDVILMDIYPARELPIEGVTSAIIYDKLTCKEKTMCNKKDALELILSKKPELLLTVGAGDIDQLIDPLKVRLAK